MRRWTRLLMAGMLVAVVGLYPLLAPRIHRIDKTHVTQIRDGMTLEEVESILGAPAGRYDWAIGLREVWIYSGGPAAPVVYLERTPSGTTQYYSGHDASWELSSGKLSKLSRARAVIWSKAVDPHFELVRPKDWTSRNGHCTVWFDPDERVTCKSEWGSSQTEPPWHNWRQWFWK